MVLINPRERTRFMKFLVVGVIGAVVDFGTFNILTGVLHMNPIVSQVFSFVAAVISNFIWNRVWTYPDSRSKSMLKQLGQFMFVSILGIGIRTPIFAILHVQLFRLYSQYLQPLPLVTPQFMGRNSALAVAVGVVMLWNFFVNRYWTYNDVTS